MQETNQIEHYSGERYPRSLEASGLMKDQFLRPAKSQPKWYGLYSDHKVDPSVVSAWNSHVSNKVEKAVIVGLPDSLVSLLPHLHHAAFLRKYCKDGRSGQDRPLLSAVKQ